MGNFINNINPIGILVFITFFYGIFNLNLKNKRHQYLMVVIFISLITETIATVLLCCQKDLSLLYSISFIFHQTVWLFIIVKSINNKKIRLLTVSSFLTFSIINMAFIEKLDLNYLTFITGSLLYISMFIYESYYQLQKENLSYFTSSDYLLLFAPVLFFLGFSFIFGFRDLDVRDTIVFGETDLYSFISSFINIIYYLMINLYIYTEQKEKNMKNV